MTRILFALFVAVIISKCCKGNKRGCYPVDVKSICYFQPIGANNNRSWEEASRACKENNSTLPTIENERILKYFKSYLNEHKSSHPDVWTAGREFRTKEWRWLDGEPIRNQTRVNGKENFAFLTKEFNFSSANNSAMHGYICKLYGRPIRPISFSPETNIVRLASGFTIVYSGKAFGFYQARRKCLDAEGDLATFEDDEDLTVLKSNHTQLLANNSLWIGLSRLLWIPNISEQKSERNITNRCRYITASDGKWHQDSCNETKGILCQAGFVFHVACHDSRRQCFEVESKDICYFAPNVSSVDWDTAWKTCRELDASLPVILNEKGHKVFTENLRTNFSGQSVWTAGRYIGNGSDWRWLNGQNFTDNEKLSRHRSDGSFDRHATQAVLTKELRYEARYPNNSYAFICSLPAANCTNKPQKYISWKNGCLEWNRPTSYELRLNEARNECLKGGGDLATFSEDGDLDHLSKNYTMENVADTVFLIGLHRKWWIWNATDVHDIKYNLLDDYGDTEKDCLFIGNHSKWSRAICSANKSVICQTVFDASKDSSANESVTEKITIVTESPVETFMSTDKSTEDSAIKKSTIVYVTENHVETSRTTGKSTEDSAIRYTEITTIITEIPRKTFMSTDKSTEDSGSAILTSKWTQRGNQGTSTPESVIKPDFSIVLLLAAVIGTIAVLANIVVAAFFIFKKSRRIKGEETGEEGQLSAGSQTLGDQCKVAEETNEMRGVYAEVTRVHGEDDGDNLNETQTSVVYAELEFVDNMMTDEEPVISNPHDSHTASDPATVLVSEPIVYATVEFADNKMAKEESVISNPHESLATNAPTTFLASDDIG